MNDQVKDDAGPTADPLLQAIDEERRRLARELHDGLGQALTGVRLLAGALSPDSKEPAQHQFQELLREAAQRTRGLCHSLEPSGEGGELADLIASVGDDLELRHQIPVEAPNEAPAAALDRTQWHLLQHAFVEAVESVGRVRDIERLSFSASATAKGMLDVAVVAALRERAVAPSLQEDEENWHLRLVRRRLGLLQGRVAVKSEPGRFSVHLRWPRRMSLDA